MSDISYEVADDGVATLTFTRPEVMNAIRPEMTAEILEAIDDVRANDAVRCLVITGEGRGFCAGDDFQAIFLAEDRTSRRISRQANRIKHGETSLDVIFGLQKPTIAAVNGPAVGYGMDIALYCDIRIARTRGSSAGSSCAAASWARSAAPSSSASSSACRRRTS